MGPVSALAAELAALDSSVVSVSESAEPAPDVCEVDMGHGPSVVFVRVEGRPYDLCAGCARRLVVGAVDAGSPMVVVQVFAWPAPSAAGRVDRWALAPIVATLGGAA